MSSSKQPARRKAALLCAPYSPIGEGPLVNLGGARKIEFAVRFLCHAGYDVTVINSAHNYEGLRGTRKCARMIGGCKVSYVEPFSLPIRPHGKLLQLLAVPFIARRLVSRPDIVWIYNSYAFEARMALNLARRHGSPIVLELEDWPTARPRAWSPKPALDLFFLWRLLPRVSLVTCVNQRLVERLRLDRRKTMLFPGVFGEAVRRALTGRVPFSGGATKTVGYFGGLTKEKGADLILALARQLPNDWRLIVTGAGPMEESIRSVAAASGGRVKFAGAVDDEELYKLVESCDAILNPHVPTESMHDGVMPFKVVEALASGRLLISTKLPSFGAEIDGATLVVNPVLTDILDALRQAAEFFNTSRLARERLVRELWASYSEEAMERELNERLGAMGITANH